MAIAPARAEPAIWVVRDADSTIYLLGTIHMLPEGTKWRSARIDKAISDSSELYLEIADIESFGAQILGAWSMVSRGMSFSRPLSKRLTPQQYADVDRAAEAAGLGSGSLDYFRPWLAAMLLDASRGTGDVKTIQGVDIQLSRQFKAKKLPVKGFETIDGQMRAFASLPEKDELAYLLDTARFADVASTSFRTLVDTWNSGNVDKLALTAVGDMKKASPALYDALLTRRNVGFADNIENLLKGKGTAIVAVGAAHLAGDDSVQSILLKRGIAAQRL
jgi:uncharacterized protein YbaP (TraB family)